MNLFRGMILVALLFVAFGGCKPEPVFPVEPALTFKEFIQHAGTDSLQVVFSFTDGDGDVGILPNSTDSNFVLTVYHRDPVTGNNVILQNPCSTCGPTDSLMYVYRIPHLTSGQAGLEGDIYVNINRTILRTLEDTVRFNAFLLDNSNHKSPYVMTDQVVILP